MMPDRPDTKVPTALDASEARAQLRTEFAEVRRRASAALARHKKLIANLTNDLERHGDPDRWKRFGDLLLANIASAVRSGENFSVTDLYDPAAPQIEIEAPADMSAAEAAAFHFKRYTKARNARRMIAERMQQAEMNAAEAAALLERIDAALDGLDRAYLESLRGSPKRPPQRSKKEKVDAAFKGARRFISSDGIEILVGKGSKDNDHLTFRIARSLDTWLHAADYPGSHVVVRSSGKKTVPHRTLIEAAELAAFYSGARELPKAAVNYTLKKYVNKPRRSAPGLVSLSSFKTILVKPGVPDIEFDAPKQKGT